jgi:subtilisin family serine protease
MELDSVGLAELTSQGSPVERIDPDRTLKPLLVESTYQIEADVAHAAGMTGSGATIVVIDTGAEKSHPFLSGKVVHEACFATNDSGRKGACPNRQTTHVGNGAGEPCTFDSLSCYHGTHVSGIALGSNATMTGVAPGATLIPIQVFHQVGTCSFLTACAEASESDVVAALEHVYEIRNQYPIVAVNMSLGGGLYSNACDADYPLMSDAITNLKSVGIATIAAAGNDGDPTGITAPACISSSISVGAVAAPSTNRTMSLTFLTARHRSTCSRPARRSIPQFPAATSESPTAPRWRRHTSRVPGRSCGRPTVTRPSIPNSIS